MSGKKFTAFQLYDDESSSSFPSWACGLFSVEGGAPVVDPKPTTKIVHFVRHGHGVHNEVGEVDHSAYLLEENEDAVLTTLGVKQCQELNQSISSKNSDKLKSAQALLVSPMRRTIQTATYSFPFHLNNIPWVALETLRERSGLHPCDRRRPVSELSKHYPHVDFTSVVEESDPLYYVYTREPDEVVNARCYDFLNDLAARPEKEIIVVGHSSYFDQLFTAIIDVKNAREKYVRFKNCELRSFILDLE